jgi:hypothetical protein
LTQGKVNYLIKLEKKRISDDMLFFPLADKFIEIPVISMDESESFLIDVNRKGTIKMSKCTYQNRYRKTNILLRLDLNGPPHSNPKVQKVPLSIFEKYNGALIRCPHLHLYTEGYGTKWAVPAEDEGFRELDDLFNILMEFFDYCNIVKPYRIQKRLGNGF